MFSAAKHPTSITQLWNKKGTAEEEEERASGRGLYMFIALYIYIYTYKLAYT
jgi:hypothetical protein